MMLIKKEINLECCCICANNNDLIRMFDQYDYEHKKQDTKTAIEECFRIHLNVIIEDRNEYVICKNCINILDDTIHLRHQIQTAYSRDENVLSTSSKSNINGLQKVAGFKNYPVNFNKRRCLVVNVIRLETLRCCCCNDNMDLRCMLETYTVNNEIEAYSNMIANCYSVEPPQFSNKYKWFYMLCKNCILRLKNAVELRLHILVAFSLIPGLFDDQQGTAMNQLDYNVLDESINFDSSDMSNTAQEYQSHDDDNNILSTFMIQCINPDKTIEPAVLKSKMNNFEDLNENIDDNIIPKRRKKAKVDAYDKTRTNKATHKCTICHKQFANRKYLRSHFKTHLKSGKILCLSCCKTFKNKSSLKSHTALHARRSQCKICKKICNNSANLKAHVATHSYHSAHATLHKRKNQCEICKKKCNSKANLKAHVATHSYKFSCNSCRKRFPDNETLMNHMIVHKNLSELSKIGGEVFDNTCDVCNKKFPSKSKLLRHMRIHTKISTKCNICDKTCSNSSNLKRHIAAHSHKFTCDKCKKSFNNKDTLINHIALHGNLRKHRDRTTDQIENKLLDESIVLQSSDKEYTSHNEDCDVSSTLTNESINRDITTEINVTKRQIICFEKDNVNMNDDIEPEREKNDEADSDIKRNSMKTTHKCTICHKQFANNNYLRRHFKTHLKSGKILCLSCCKSFKDKSSLKAHAALHTPKNQCEICKKICNNSANLKAHVATHSYKFSCNSCRKRFPDNETLMNHMIIHMNLSELINLEGKVFDNTCDVCSKKFRNKSRMLRHMRIHTNITTKCNICDKTCSNSSNLKRHMATHSHKFTCDMCKKGFNNKKSLSVHINRHRLSISHNAESIIGNYRCDVCNKKFPSKYKLLRHMRIHTNISTKCNICDKTCSNSSNLKRHMATHSHKFTCDMCKKGFNNKKSLSVHINSHRLSISHNAENIIGNYRCDVCNNSFSSKFKIERHMRLHSNKSTKCNMANYSKKTEFICEHCGKCLSRIDSLKKHLYMCRRNPVKKAKEPYKCTICEREFVKTSTFKMHMKMHQKRMSNLKCKLCDTKFDDETSLNYHIVTHPGVKSMICDLCNKLFSSKTTLRCHMKLHYNRCAYLCDICNKDYSSLYLLKVHMLVHYNVRNEVCDICNKNFTVKHQLKRHMKIHQREMKTEEIIKIENFEDDKN